MEDILSSFKIFYFYLYILMGYTFAVTEVKAINYYVKWYFIIVLVSLIFSIIELTIPSVSYFLYKRDNIEILDDKLSSIFNTTYHFAFFLFFGYIYILIRFFDSIKKRKGNTISTIFFCLILLIAITLTQSRMFFIISIILLIALTVSFVINKITNILVVITTIVFFIALFSIYFYYEDLIQEKLYYILNGIIFLFSGEIDFSGQGSGSFNTRINQIIQSHNALNGNIFIGAGTGKGLLLESLYAYLIYKYAYSGLVLYFIIWFFLLRVILKQINTAENDNEMYFFKTCFIFFFLSPIYFLSGPLYEVPKLSQFFFILIGLIYGTYYSKKSCKNEKQI
ncbi:TPA: hypothetical protein U2J54_002425 [Providencia rettgeri]|uniref:hypothetical protein n=1 Tax=Providencia sp. VP23HZSY-1 TaxID=3391806 RepID=UPI0024AC6DE3|nr:hypothetical protein [Providencia rettgeri]ELR5187730.1 hypothetical protein [Providencia rettgeri]HEM7509415.1 hypothetical protein [Providencia rettgeri]